MRQTVGLVHHTENTFRDQLPVGAISFVAEKVEIVEVGGWLLPGAACLCRHKR
jgi:hypothetical protein